MGVGFKLLRPVEMMGRKIERLDFRPVEFDDVLRWQEGRIKGGIIGLLADLTGRKEIEIRKVTYPDMDTLMALFMQAIPSVIRDDIERGQIPQYQGDADDDDPEPRPEPPIPDFDEGDTGDEPTDYIPEVDGPRPPGGFALGE